VTLVEYYFQQLFDDTNNWFKEKVINRFGIYMQALIKDVEGQSNFTQITWVRAKLYKI